MQTTSLRKSLSLVGAALLITIIITASLTTIFPIFRGRHNYDYPPPGELQRFESIGHMANYLQTHTPEQYLDYYYNEEGDSSDESLSSSDTYLGHSTTNIQVEGVDEPDAVKTDGQYLYTISKQNVLIVQAYPPENAQVVAQIEPTGNPCNLLLYKSSRLIIHSYHYYRGIKQIIEVYDVTSPTNPVLSQNLTFEGYYCSARLIDKYLYFIGYSYAYARLGSYNLPKLEINQHVMVVQPWSIYYDSGIYDYTFCYNTVIGLDITDANALPNIETILVGAGAGVVYSSLTNLYIVVAHYPLTDWFDRRSYIHRFAINEGQIRYQASGSVPGYIINQFALDEYDDHLRVATTTWENTVRVNNIYVFNLSMNVIGTLQGLAPTEWIYSVRFLGTTGYLVTFNKVDPLFVINLTNPRAPFLLGELEIPGYSDYLHPLGDNQLLGIGKNVTIDESGEFWWFQGVKLSIFNASDPLNPSETVRIEIGVRGTYTPVLDDHHAILIDPDRNLLVLPILIYEYTEDPPEDPWDYGNKFWQGAMVFHIDASTGTLTSRGNITHIESSEDLTYWSSYRTPDRYIYRALYIGDVLYTLSPTKLALHDLNTLAYIDTLTFVS